MIERDMAEKNKILEIVTGSWLYGTANPETSDKDYVGIFMPNVEYILGFKRCEEVDFSIIEKQENGKNTKDALDRKLYEFRKYIKLAIDCNPNILELLFVNKENAVFIDDIGEELLKIRHLFPYKGLKQKFLGYAYAQRHKMLIKKDNYFDLVRAKEYIDNIDDGKYLVEIVNDKNLPSFIQTRYSEQHHIKFIYIGDLNIAPSKTIQDTKKIIQERLDKVGNREELLLKHSFDTKFASHLVRLMLEGIELLTTGELKFPLKEREMLKDIKNGKWDIQKVLSFAIDLEKEVESLENSSKLPNKPNIEIIEDFTIKQLRKML